MIDSFVQEHIPDDVKHLTAPEFEPFRFLSITGLGRCIAGMNNIAIGKFKKGEELIREGAKMGDPYSIFALYKMYAAQNSFGIEPDKNTAWYYLICAVFSFFSSLFYEEAPLEILNTYVDMFDKDNFENSIDIIANGVEDDCTPFQEHKELILFVFTYLMQSDQDVQKQSIIEYFKETKADLPKELLLIKLFMLYNEDLPEVLATVKSEKFREYVTQNVKEYITLYNQSGTVGISGTSVAVYNSVLFNLFYLICMGKELADENSMEIEDLVMELYQFCCVSSCKDFSKLSGVHADSLSQLTKLDVILDGILIYLYSKGCYLNKNREKTLDYLQPYTNSPYEEIEDSELVSLRDYLVYVRGYKFYKDIKYDEEAKKMLKNISDVYTEERISEIGEAAMPIDYYIAGYIQEELLGDAEKANKLYLEGIKVSNQVNDYGLMVGFVAFKRKCQKRAGKQTNKQI